MKTLITYGSKYGSAKNYAEKFAKSTGFSVSSYNRVRNISDYERVIHFGALYAGGVKGLKHIASRLLKGTKLIIITVGLADVCDFHNTDNIKKSIKSQIPEKVLKRCEIFHLRGAIDYKKLSLKHRAMMALLYAKAKRLPEEKRTPEIRAMIETYGKQVSFISESDLRIIQNKILI